MMTSLLRASRLGVQSPAGACARTLLVLGLLLAAWPAPAAAQTGAITGTVTDAGSALLASVNVWAYDASGNLLSSALTNASGEYTLTGLATATYYVRTQNNLGYIDELYSDKACNAGWCGPVTAGTGVSVTSGATTPGINFALAVGGTITGTLTDADTAAPLTNTWVYVYTAAGPLTGVLTNESGVFTVMGMTTGTYYVLRETASGTSTSSTTTSPVLEARVRW